MARKSPLTEKQWKEIEARLVNGEAGCALAKKYGVTYNTIKKRFGAGMHQVKKVAAQIVATESALKSLPLGAQISAVNLAHKLRSISEHLGSASEYGAMTAHRLMGIAHQQSQVIDDANPLGEESMEALKGIRALAVTANDASLIGREILKANKEAIDDLNKQADKPEPKQIVFTVADASS